MGCLFFPLELLGDAIIEGWFFLMEWIIPERYFSRTFRTVLRILVWVFSALHCSSCKRTEECAFCGSNGNFCKCMFQLLASIIHFVERLVYYHYYDFS